MHFWVLLCLWFQSHCRALIRDSDLLLRSDSLIVFFTVWTDEKITEAITKKTEAAHREIGWRPLVPAVWLCVCGSAVVVTWCGHFHAGGYFLPSVHLFLVQGSLDIVQSFAIKEKTNTPEKENLSFLSSAWWQTKVKSNFKVACIWQFTLRLPCKYWNLYLSQEHFCVCATCVQVAQIRIEKIRFHVLCAVHLISLLAAAYPVLSFASHCATCNKNKMSS